MKRAQHIALYRKGLRIARALARRYAATGLAEDLEQEAMVAFHLATITWDGRGSLVGYARWRMRHAVQEALRREDHLTREQRAAVKRGDWEAPRRHAVSHTDVRTDERGHVLHPLAADDEWLRADEAIDRTRLLPVLLATLGERDRDIMQRRLRGETLAGAGAAHGVTEARASQIMSRITRDLHQTLSRFDQYA